MPTIESMPFYTLVLDYAGGTYVSQISAPSEKSACVKWARQLDVSAIPGLGHKAKESLVQQMKADSPVAFTGTVNAWCTSASVRGKLALINLVRTARNGNPRQRTANRRASAQQIVGPERGERISRLD
jgi:hypothetical protein